MLAFSWDTFPFGFIENSTLSVRITDNATTIATAQNSLRAIEFSYELIRINIIILYALVGTILEIGKFESSGHVAKQICWRTLKSLVRR